MATPTEKNPVIDQLLFEVFGVDRIEAVQGDRCSFCGQPAKSFRDELSRKEFRISGMCQACQDKVFPEDED